MNLSGPGIIYILLVIPTIFALAVVGQGIFKLTKGEKDGTMISIFGATFLVIIVLAYIFFIR